MAYPAGLPNVNADLAPFSLARTTRCRELDCRGQALECGERLGSLRVFANCAVGDGDLSSRDVDLDLTWARWPACFPATERNGTVDAVHRSCFTGRRTSLANESSRD